MYKTLSLSKMGLLASPKGKWTEPNDPNPIGAEIPREPQKTIGTPKE
jgi:hypothetical protein